MFQIFNSIFSLFSHVMLPKDLARLVPKSHLMTESEWRAIGVQQSRGWVSFFCLFESFWSFAGSSSSDPFLPKQFLQTNWNSFLSTGSLHDPPTRAARLALQTVRNRRTLDTISCDQFWTFCFVFPVDWRHPRSNSNVHRPEIVQRFVSSSYTGYATIENIRKSWRKIGKSLI